mgnify:CR=1 FL=1
MLLPLRALFWLSDIVRFILFDIIKYRADVEQSNLANSFTNKSKAEIEAIARSFNKHFCDITVESLKMSTMRRAEVKKRVKFKNIDLVQKYYDAGRNVLLYSSHVGNWEWLITMPLYFDAPSSALYQKQSSNYINELMLQIRSRFGVRCIESKFAYRALLTSSQSPNPFIICIIGDQVPKRNSTVHWVSFLNQKTAFFTGAAKIARKFDCVILYPSFRKIARGRYEVTFQLLSESSINLNDQAIVELYSSALEEQINDTPEMWLWSHKRWKRKSEDFVVMQKSNK